MATVGPIIPAFVLAAITLSTLIACGVSIKDASAVSTVHLDVAVLYLRTWLLAIGSTPLEMLDEVSFTESTLLEWYKGAFANVTFP